MEHNVPKILAITQHAVFYINMVFEVNSARDLLQEEFDRRLRLNSRYSLRSFSRLLGISSGALSEILKGTRPISLKSAAKMAKALGLTTVESRKFVELIQNDKLKTNEIDAHSLKVIPDANRKNLDQDMFALVSEWQNFAILNLLDCADFKWDVKHVSLRLGIPIQQAKESMKLLIRLGLVVKRGQQIKGVDDFILAPEGISSRAIRKYHKQILEKAIESIEFQNIHERDLSGIGFAVNPMQLPQIKKEISAFQEQLLSKYSKGKRTEVYFLEMILFKLTKGSNIHEK